MVDGSDRDLSTVIESATTGGGGFEVLTATSGAALDLPDGEWILKAAFDRQGHDLVIEGRDGERLLIRDYFSHEDTPDLSFGEGTLRGHVVERLAGPMAEGYAQTGASDGSSVGAVDNVNGEAWVVHVDGSREPIATGTAIYSGDVVETSPNGSLTIAFIDGTSLSLSEDSRMVIDELVFDPGAATNTASFSLVQGLFVLVSGDVAKTGDMTIETPVSTIGIRGTSVAIQAATEGLRNLITLLADPDGNIGIVEVATLVGRVILDTLGASTSVTSSGLAPTPVEVLTAEQIETAYRAALTTMQTRTGTSLGVQKDVEGDTPDSGTDGDDGADSGEPTVEEVQAFYQAVEDLIAALQNVGVDGEDLTEEQEDELVEEAAAVVIPPKPLPDILQSLPEKERNDDNSGDLDDDDDTTADDSGGSGDLRFHNNSTDSFGTNLEAQFGVADSGALGTQSDNPTSPEGFVNTTEPGGFYFNPDGATNFSDPITSGTPNSGYTIGYEEVSLDNELGLTTVTGKNANEQNDLGVSTSAAIHDDAVVATSEGENDSIALTQTVTLTEGTSYVVVEVLLENLSSDAQMLYYLQSINPNQDAVGDTPTQETYNQVLDNPGETGDAIVAATGPNSGVSFVMYADQDGIQAVNDELDDAVVSVHASVSPTNTFEDDPTQSYLFNDPDLGGSQADVAINLTYLIEELGAGESAYLSFVLSLNIASSIDDFLFALPGSTTVDGLAGDDTILGGDDNDLLLGNSGNDHIDGNDGDDELLGGAGDDQVSGNDGDDVIVWQNGDGSDNVDGGDGTDTLMVETSEADPATVSVTQNGDHDVIVGVDGAVAAVADNVEQLVIETGDGDDTVVINDLLGTDLGSTLETAGSLDAFVVSSSPDRVWLNDGDATFSAGQTLFDGSSTDVVLGDLNDDGFLDAVISNSSTGAQVFFNDGDGSFSAGGTFGAAARGLAIGDFDDDGSEDIFLINSCGGSTVFFNDGQGGLDNSGQSLTTVSLPQAAAVGDVDGDGSLDVVVAGFDKASPTLQVLLNDGAGTFSSGDGETFGLAYDVALADLDGDDDLDAVAVGLFGAQVLLNSGSGNFSEFGAPVVKDYLFSVALGDLDGDGHVDMVVAGSYGVEVFGNSGSGAFNSLQTLTGNLYGSPDVELGDLDGDGDLDIFLANGSGTDQVFLNQGDGSFVDGQNLGVFNNGQGVALGDLDGDGETISLPPVYAELGDGDDTANAAVAGVGVELFGEGGDDTLIGGVSDDTLDGGSDNDLLAGNLGDDVLRGESGNDSLQGSAGDDTLDGGSGDDTLDGGLDDDDVNGGSGNDLMLWEAGASASSSDGSDDVDGGSGEDVLRLLGHSGDDTFVVTAGGLQMFEPQPTVSIEHSQSGDDLVVDNTERLEFHGGDGSDHVTIADGLGVSAVQTVLFEGGDGDDFLDGEGQSSVSVEITAIGGVGNDVLIGGHGNDVLFGGDDNDAIYAAQGNDRLYGGAGDDTIEGGDGADTIEGYYGADRIEGGRGNDVLYGGAGNDFFAWYGGHGAGSLAEASDGDDVVDGGSGNDILSILSDYSSQPSAVTLSVDGGLEASSGNAELIVDVTDGENSEITAIGIEQLNHSGGTGDDILVIEGDLNLAGVTGVGFYGFAGDDTFDGAGAGDGGFGATAHGGYGNDLLIGTGGNDLLSGDDDDDELVSAMGQGNDSLDGGSGNDEAVIYDVYDSSVLLVSGDAGNDVIVTNGDTTIVVSEVEDLAILGSANDDVISLGALDGNDPAVTVFGGGGNDQIVGASLTLESIEDLPDGDAEFDTNKPLVLFGEGGEDILIGGNANDLLVGGDDSDLLFGFGGDDTVLGGAGNDIVLWLQGGTVGSYAGNDVVLPYGGSDIIDGGDGYDSLAIFALGEGALEATISAGNLRDATIASSITVDVASENAVIDVSNVERLAIGASLYGLGEAAGNDVVVLEGDLAAAGIDLVAFYGGGGDDVLDAGNAGDGFIITAFGGEGDDALIGAGGNDVLVGGAGDDYLYGGDGEDLIDGGEGNDEIVGGYGYDLIYGGAGDDVIVWYGGYEYAYYGEIYGYEASDGDDVIDGGDGIDTLILYGGAYYYYGGYDYYDGAVAYLYAAEDPYSEGDSYLNVYFGYSYSNLTVRDVEEVYVEASDVDTAVIVENDLGAAGVTLVEFVGGDGDDFFFGGGGGNDALFYNNTVDDEHVPIEGGDHGFHVTAFGGGGNDVLVASSGNDYLHGGTGNDILVSGVATGNDHLVGGSGFDGAEIYGTLFGNDRVTVSGDAGNDVIVDGDGTTLTIDEVEGLLVLGGDGNDVVVLRDLDGTDLVSGEIGFFGGGGDDYFDARHAGLAVVAYGNSGNDFLYGGDGGDALYGESGDDFIVGSGDNDTLDGGSGDDRINWYASSDGSDHDGDDVVEGGSGNDELLVTGGTLNQDVTLTTEGLVDDIVPALLVVTVASDNATIVAQNVETFVLEGGQGNEVLVIEDDVSDVGVSLVVLEGNDGDDVVDGNGLGDGGFSIQAYGGAGDDVFFGSGGDDTLSGDDGDDTMDGAGGNDTIAGGAGNDLVEWYDGDGDDDLDGGADFDTLVVETGVSVSSDSEIVLGVADSNDEVGEITGTLEDQATFRNFERIEIEGDGGNDTIVVQALSGTGVLEIAGDLGAGNDVFEGSSGDIAVSIFGGAGLDSLTGGTGDDTFDGGDDDDSLAGGDGDDILSGGGENDHLYGGSGSDGLYGGAGDDELIGGDGRDTIHGDDGDDRIFWLSGSGNDTVDGGAGNDTLTIAGTSADDVISVTASGNDIVIVVNNETITASSIEEVVFAGGDGDDDVTIGDLSGTSVSNNTLVFLGGNGNDVLDAGAANRRVEADGGHGDDTLEGGALDDVLYGGTGNDLLIGGQGNDQLTGSSGNDTYVYDADQGSDTISDDSGTDQITFTLLEGVDLDDQAETFRQSGNDLVIDTIYGHSIVIENHFSGDAVESYVGTSSNLWSGLQTFSVELLQEGQAATSSFSPGDIVVDVIFGTSGDDVIRGGGDFDFMQAGTGSDNVLVGAVGLYYYDAAGNDRIYGALYNDIDGISYLDQTNAVTITEAELTVVHDQGLQSAPATQVDTFSNVEEFYGGQGNDVFVGDPDFYNYWGYSYWEGYRGDDTITGGANADQVGYFFSTGGVYVDLDQGFAFDGMGGTDTFLGSIEDVFGSRFDDTIIGNSGSNWIDGFRGDDLLMGGSGNDVYKYDLRDGSDTISDTGGSDDRIRMDFDQIATNAVRSADGNDLLITTSAGETITIVDQFNGQEIEWIQDESTRGGYFRVDILDSSASENGSLTELIVGTEGSDSITSTGGFDYVFGGAGEDILVGGASEGTAFTPGADNDLVVGHAAGNDEVSWRDHADGAVITFDGSGNGSATFGSGEVDTFQNIWVVYGSQGDDTITSTGSGFSWLEGSGGDDTLIGNGSADHIGFFGAPVAIDFTLSATGDGVFDGGDALGIDTYFDIESVGGTRFDDRIEGNDGANRLTGYQGSDVLVGHGGNDRLDGREGFDALDGGSGDDTLLGGDDGDTLVGGVGNDYIEGDDSTRSDLSGDDHLEGGDGHDTLDGGNGDDTLIGGADNDLIDGGDGFDALDLSGATGPVVVDLGANTAVGEGVDVVLNVERVIGTSDNDMITGAQSPVYAYQEFMGGAGDDTLTGSSNDLIEDLADFSDATGGVMIDLAIGTASGAGIGNDTLVEIDSVRGSAFSDVIVGGNNDEYEAFIGGAGGDSIDGGAGFDDAFYHEDPFRISAVLIGDNAFTVVDGYGDTDTLSNIERLTGSRYDDTFDLSASFNGTIQVRGRDGSDTIDGSGGIVEAVYNQSPWSVYVDLGEGYARDGYDTIDTLIDVEWARGGAYADTLIGSGADNRLRGGGGNDLLQGAIGNDTLLGEAGNDTLQGGDDDDTLTGGTGLDTIDGGAGNDTILWSVGDDSDTIDGGDGFDVLTIYGSAADDTFDVGKNASNDVIVTIGDETLTVSNVEELVFDLGDDNDRVIIGDLSGTSISNETITVLGGLGDDELSAWDVTDKSIVASGGEGADNLETGGGNDVLNGDSGDDQLSSRGGDDMLIGGTDSDYLLASGSLATLLGGLDDDQLNSSDGSIAALDGGDGNDIVVVYSGLAAVTDSGSDGNDALDVSAAPEDIAFWRPGDGQLFIVDNDAPGADDDVNPLQVQVVGFDTDMNTGSGFEFFGGSEEGMPWRLTDTPSGDSDMVILASNEIGSGVVAGGVGNDWLVAGERSGQELHGDGGDDILSGSSWAETLTGGSGDDTIINGGGGSDAIDAGSGNDLVVISETDGAFTTGVAVDSDGSDTIEFLRSFSIASIGSAGNDLAIESVNGSTVMLTNQLGGGFAEFEFHELSEIGAGSRWGEYTFVDGATGTAGNDFIVGTGADNGALSGGSGDDLVMATAGYTGGLLQGGDGNDVLGGGNALMDNTYDGGGGFDVVSLRQYDNGVIADLDTDGAGGAANGTISRGVQTDVLISIAGLLGGIGNDTFTGSSGDDLLDGGGGNDVLVGGNGNDSYIVRPGDGDDTISDIGGSADAMIFLDGRDDHTLPVDFDMSQVGNDLVIDDGMGGSQTIVGQFSGNEIELFVFRDGSHFMPWDDAQTYTFGAVDNSGDDLIVGTAGNDTLDGGAGDDVIYGSGGDDELAGGAGDDNLAGGAGDDVLDGGDHDDTLAGGAGNDTLAGGAGNDLLDGGAGDDMLQGGAGNDLYYVEVDDGAADTITDSGGLDSIWLDDDLGLGAATARVGDDLVIDITNGLSSATIEILGQFADGAAGRIEAIYIGEVGYQISDIAEGEGSISADLMVGDDGDNLLAGADNYDALFGGGGNDTIAGGTGADIMAGGGGDDFFYYESTDDILQVTVNGTLDELFPDEAPVDRILDFTSGADSLVFESADFGEYPGLVLGTNFSVIAGSWDGTDAGSNTAFAGGQATFVYSQADSVLYYDDNGTDAGYYAVAQVDQPGASDIVMNGSPP